MLNLDPDLYLFHDIITDSEIEHVKKLAKPQVSVFNSAQLLPVMILCSTSGANLDLFLQAGRLILQRGLILEGCAYLKVELKWRVLIRKEIFTRTKVLNRSLRYTKTRELLMLCFLNYW